MTLRSLLMSLCIGLTLLGQIRDSLPMAAAARGAGLDPKAKQGGEPIIIGEDATGDIAREIRAVYPRVLRELERAIGWELQDSPRIVLVGRREDFEEMSGSPLVAAFAVPDRQMAVLNLPAIAAQPYMLGETLKHELCHLLLHENIPAADLPKWLDEGVCQWVSGSLGEILIGRKEYGSLAVDLGRRAFPLRQISRAFPRDKHGILLAYEQSRSFMEYISSQYGVRALHAILAHLKAGSGVDGAFQLSLSKSVDTIEEEWREHIGRRLIWIVWLSQYIEEAVFFLCALLALIAFVRIKLRKRRYPDEDEEEDEAESGFPPDNERQEPGNDRP